MRSVVILGSTGSIGENTLRVIAALPDDFRVAGLAARVHSKRILEQALAFGVKRIALSDPSAAQGAREAAAKNGIEVLEGEDGVTELARAPEADVVLCALVGLSGLKPSLAAIESGHDLALSTKEVLVSAGEYVMRRRLECGVSILPVDSEHSAIFQALQSPAFQPFCVRPTDADPSLIAETRVDRLILTASGGSFFSCPDIDFDKVTVEQALRHPRWSMGPKVTVDSATMMNKGLEILEAHWLFNIPSSQIDVVVHPQSVVHSLVTYRDGSTMAQLSPPDMRLPIQFALSWPERLKAPLKRLDLAGLGQLTFAEPDENRFPCLHLTREAIRAGGTLTAVMNAADEVAVGAFLQGQISFADIWRVIDSVMSAHDVKPCTDLESVCEADAWARRKALDVLKNV